MASLSSGQTGSPLIWDGSNRGRDSVLSQVASLSSGHTGFIASAGTAAECAAAGAATGEVVMVLVVVVTGSAVGGV